MSLEDKLNRLNENVFGKDAKEIRIGSIEVNHLEDDFPKGCGSRDIPLEQEHEVDG